MFGNKLKYMSVKGYRGNLALHPKIWRALFSLINDKAGTQITPKAFNQVLNKVFSNRKTNITKVSAIIEEKKEDGGDEDDDNYEDFDRELSNHQSLPPRYLSPSPSLDNESRTSSPARVDNQEKFQKFPVDIEEVSTQDKSATASNCYQNSSMIPPTVPSIHSIMYTRTLMSTVPSAITSNNSNSHFYTQSIIPPIVSSAYSHEYPKNHTAITSLHPDLYPQHQSTNHSNLSTANNQNQPKITPNDSSSYSHHQPTVPSTISSTYSNPNFHTQPMIPPRVSSTYSHQYPQVLSILKSQITLIYS
ncbi:uncharacterized protein LOC141538157 [Cotesia typhae]|uniref:uncharacterized protein LOC141538157 n=2 Tax=Cotesia typhae TaxID=2053667 RepID=UPI003D68E18F